jgi:hypothetical protein
VSILFSLQFISNQFNRQTLPNFVAPYFVNDNLVDKVNKAHSKMFGQSSSAVKIAYLEKVTVWPLAGASLFAVQVNINNALYIEFLKFLQQPRKSPKHVILSIDEDTVIVLSPPNMVRTITKINLARFLIQSIGRFTPVLPQRNSDVEHYPHIFPPQCRDCHETCCIFLRHYSGQFRLFAKSSL